MKRFLIIVLSLQYVCVSFCEAKPSRIRVMDVAALTIANHDLFTRKVRNHGNLGREENGRLDLSTLYTSGKSFLSGGHPHNFGDPLSFTITKKLIQFHQNQYKLYISRGLSEEDSFHQARKNTVKEYIFEYLKPAFERVFESPFPTAGVSGELTDNDKMFYQGLHDLLPNELNYIPPGKKEKIRVGNWVTSETDLPPYVMLSTLPGFDGNIDIEITVPVNKAVIKSRPSTHRHWKGSRLWKFSLKHLDQVSADRDVDVWTFQDVMGELKAVGKGFIPIAKTHMAQYVYRIMQKGICNIEDGGVNPWIPNEFHCDSGLETVSQKCTPETPCHANSGD